MKPKSEKWPNPVQSTEFSSWKNPRDNLIAFHIQKRKQAQSDLSEYQISRDKACESQFPSWDSSRKYSAPSEPILRPPFIKGMQVAVGSSAVATAMLFLGLQPALELEARSVILDSESLIYTRTKDLPRLPSSVPFLPAQDSYAFHKGCSTVSYRGGSNEENCLTVIKTYTYWSLEWRTLK